MIAASRKSVETSVVIPAYNEAESIGACVDALLAGSVIPLEIIVADGGSNDATRDVARAHGATVVDNLGRTAASGRNVGWRASRGSAVAFVDADCTAVPGWLEALERRLEDETIDGIAGRISPREPRNECEAYWNHLAWEVLMHFGDEPSEIKGRELAHSVVTASCCYRRSTLERLGGFDEWFGNNAEDVDLTWRALDAGCRLVYEPAAQVWANGVTDVTGVRRKAFRNGVSSSKLQKRYGTLVNHDWAIYRMLLDNLRGRSACEHPALERNELVWHLLGKYWGSLRHGVINV